MNDRELLEFAAKAAGLYVKCHVENMDDQCIGLKVKPYKDASRQLIAHWNPLTDDGDAWRLAVKLNLFRAYIYEDQVSLAPSEYGIIEPCNDDPYSATRRSIVRAAAQIGKAMP